MQQLPPQVHIAIQTIKPMVEPIEGVEAQLRKAFDAALNHWLLRGGEQQNILKAGVGAVMCCYKMESIEYRRLENEVQGLVKLSAFLTACQAGLTILPPDDLMDEEIELYGIINIFNEVKDAQDAST